MMQVFVHSAWMNALCARFGFRHVHVLIPHCADAQSAVPPAREVPVECFHIACRQQLSRSDPLALLAPVSQVTYVLG